MFNHFKSGQVVKFKGNDDLYLIIDMMGKLIATRGTGFLPVDMFDEAEDDGNFSVEKVYETTRDYHCNITFLNDDRREWVKELKLVYENRLLTLEEALSVKDEVEITHELLKNWYTQEQLLRLLGMMWNDTLKEEITKKAWKVRRVK